MKKYFKPKVSIFSTSDLAEAIGPVQTAYANIDIQGWRGTKLERPGHNEYRLAEKKNVNIYSAKGVENA